MSKRDSVDMVSSSLSSIIRQSLNASFRRECFHLLQVTSNKDVQDKIQSLLKSRKQKGLQQPSLAAPCPQPSSEGGEALNDDRPHPTKLYQEEKFRRHNEETMCVKSEDALEKSTSSDTQDHSYLEDSQKLQPIDEEKTQTYDISDEETELDWDDQSSSTHLFR